MAENSNTQNPSSQKSHSSLVPNPYLKLVPPTPVIPSYFIPQLGVSSSSQFFFHPPTEYATKEQSSTIQPFGSQFPPHSTQVGLENIQVTEEVDVVEVPARPKKIPWSQEEEICIAKAWSTISNCSKVGNDQKSKDFWMKTAAYYNEARPEGSPIRKWEAIKAHHYRVMPDINIFTGWYNNFYNNRASWQSDEDVLESTLRQWRSVYPKKEFKYQHVWKVMRDLEKWAPQQLARHANKKAKTSESEDHISTEPEARSRPMGQQMAKKQDKAKAKAVEKNDMWEKLFKMTENKMKMREDELKIKEKEFERAYDELKYKEWELIRSDTSTMTDAELYNHAQIVASIKKKQIGFDFI